MVVRPLEPSLRRDRGVGRLGGVVAARPQLGDRLVDVANGLAQQRCHLRDPASGAHPITSASSTRSTT